MEMDLCADALQVLLVKNVILVTHAHQIHVEMESVLLWELNFSAHVLETFKAQLVPIKILASPIHALIMAYVCKLVQALCVNASQDLLDQNVTSAIHAHQIHA